MDDHQRFVMAADTLYGARNSDGDSQLPPDGLVEDFAANIGVACADAGEDLGVKVIEVAASLYVMADDYKP